MNRDDGSGLVVKDLGFLDWEPISLTVGCGNLSGISGVSGSGKSLLLRAISDLLESTGEVSWRGQKREEMEAPIWRARVGLLSANPVWWFDRVEPHMVGDVSQWLQLLGFAEDVLDWQIARLSSGERQRLAVVRLLGRRPECLLLDEPTANLDGEATGRVERVIHEYINQSPRSRAGVIVSHDLALLSRMCERHWVMRDRALVTCQERDS